MANDSTAVAVYKLAMESQQYVAAAQAAMQANQGLAASAAPVAAGEEKIDRALRGGEAALDRKIARFDAASRINAKYAKEFADLVKIEEAGIGSAEKRAKALEVVTAAHQKELEALERVKKSNAENAVALGNQNSALQVAAAAGDRYAQALLEMQQKQAALNAEMNKLGLAEHARLINLTQEAYRNSTTSLAHQEAQMRKSATSTGLARHELINLSRQFQDIGVSLAGGQSPFRILIEQGSQIADVFASSKAKIADVFAAIGTSIRSIGFGAVAGVIGGVVTALVTGAVSAAVSWQSARKQIEISLLGIGAASGATVDKIEQIAISSEKMWAGLSRSEAREFAGALAATGQVGVESIEKMTKAGKDFATIIGKDSTEAAKMLAKAMQDPGQGIQQLNQVLGAFDAATIRTVQNLAAQGKVMEANTILTNHFAAAVEGAADKADVMTKAWTAATNWLSNLWTKLGSDINKLAGMDVGAGSDKAIQRLQQQLADIQRLRAEGGQASARGAPRGLEMAEQKILDKLREQLGIRDQINAKAERTRAILQSIADEKTLRELLPDIAMFEQLNNRLEAARRILAAARAEAEKTSVEPGGGIQGRTGASMAQIVQAEQRAAQARATALSQSEKLTSSYETQLLAIRARTSEERDALAAQQKSVELAGQALTAAERHTEIERAVTLEREKQAAATRDTIAGFREQAAIAEAAPGPERAGVEDQVRFNELRREGKTIEEASNIVAAQRAAIIAQANAAIQEQITALRQAVQLDEARLSGTVAQTKAEQASENAIRSGASAQAAKVAGQAAYNAELRKALVQEAFSVKNHQAALQAINARTSAERIAVAEVQAYNQALEQGKFLWQAQADAARAVEQEIARQAATHRDNMAALEDQLRIARARTEQEQLSAQYEADINARLREGATLMQAEEEAAMRRKIAEEGIAKKRIESARAAEEAERRITAERNAQYEALVRSVAEMGKQLTQQNKIAANAAELSAKLMVIGPEWGGSGATRDIGPVRASDIRTTYAGGGPLVGAAGMSTPLNISVFDLMLRSLMSDLNARAADQAGAGIQGIIDAIRKGFDPDAQKEAARAAEDAARAQQEAAAAAKEAAEAQIEAAKAAREAYISQLDEAVADIVATKLLAGQSAQAVNMLIETGAIQFGTASTRFQTQLDLYKRAGASNAQIAADIRAGIIGEGARPSELLAALDSLTDAVDANTDAQLGLSPFYTSQGDRQLGYRGYTVQRGASNIPGTLVGGSGGTGTIGGTGGLPGGMGGIINPPGQVAAEFIPGVGMPAVPQNILLRYLGGRMVEGYYDASGIWHTTRDWGRAPGIAPRADTVGVPIGSTAPTSGFNSPTSGPGMIAPYQSFAEGGIADRPMMGRFGEAGPEAFVPLKGGAIPVRLVGNAANQNRPSNVVNINAPLVNFMAEPTSDEVRQSAYQAAQMLRRVAMG